MKTLKTYLTILQLSIILIATGCTHNNGDIGPLFGKWKLSEIAIDNKAYTEYSGNIFWSFQSSVICMTKVGQHNSYAESYGSWQQSGDILTLRFPDEVYPPFAELKLQRNSDLQIIRLSGDEMILSYITTEGSDIIYKFKKW